MSYIDAIYSKDEDLIHVVERNPNGDREYKEFKPMYEFFYEDPKGKFLSTHRKALTRVSCKTKQEFDKEKRIFGNKQLYESDINVVFKCLSENYRNCDLPKTHNCFFDIEVDWCSSRGFAPPDDPFNKVTAITMYLDWSDTLVTLAIPPSSISIETATELCADIPNLILFSEEKEMFETFFALTEDVDVFTGWNSEGFDVPYMVNRVIRVMGREYTKNFCLWGQYPKSRTYERFGTESVTYDFVGKIHMDYLQLYKKYNYESRHSYSLNSIGEMEVGETKVDYEGSLDQLYNNDFRKFIEYNQQDVMLLYKIHAKLKFLDLASALAHENTVLFQTVMGSVAMIEQAIINEAHDRGFKVKDKDRKRDKDAMSAAGAFVADPKRGFHEDIGAVDLNSLYPSTIRSANMAPETLVGQIRQTQTDAYMAEKMKQGIEGAALWEGMFNVLEFDTVHKRSPAVMLTIDYEDGRSVEKSAAEVWDMVYNSHKPYVLTANGTIFTYEFEGVIPGILTRWYSERKSLQKKAKECTGEEHEYWDKRQLVRKILLNSAYGALLNEHCRFYDKRIGQSVTLTGRQIVRHMMSHINEQIEGTYSHTGGAIIYGDTDSCYFTVKPFIKEAISAGDMSWSKEACIELYDNIAENVNASFPAFMEKTFHIPRKNGEIIRAGREVVADRGIFITKKRYALNIIDKEGKRQDIDGKLGKVKAMGLDLKRSDTPKFIQEFLSELLSMVIQKGKDKDDVITRIKEFKTWLMEQPGWTKGSPKGVNNLTAYTAKVVEKKKFGEIQEKVNMPGHVRASINWNYLRRINGDNYSMSITDGAKIIVCKLKDNPLKLTSIAYPVDEKRLPAWFKELPFDHSEMEKLLVDEKVENLFGDLGWGLREATIVSNTFDDLFSFD